MHFPAASVDLHSDSSLGPRDHAALKHLLDEAQLHVAVKSFCQVCVSVHHVLNASKHLWHPCMNALAPHASEGSTQEICLRHTIGLGSKNLCSLTMGELMAQAVHAL